MIFHNLDFWPKCLFWRKISFLTKNFGFGQKFRFLSIFNFFIQKIYFWIQKWNLRHRLHQKIRKNGKNCSPKKKVTFGRKCIGRVYIASRAKIVIFTHPIFESDFDCLTGKNRLHANSLPSPLASDKTKNLQKKCFWNIFFAIWKHCA